MIYTHPDVIALDEYISTQFSLAETHDVAVVVERYRKRLADELSKSLARNT